MEHLPDLVSMFYLAFGCFLAVLIAIIIIEHSARQDGESEIDRIFEEVKRAERKP